MESLKNKVNNLACRVLFSFILFALCFPASAWSNSREMQNGNSDNHFKVYKGVIVDKSNGDPLAFASLAVVGTNISVVSNSEGEFLLKIPADLIDPQVFITYIGYKANRFPLAGTKPDKLRIEMEPSSVQLPELSVISRDATDLVRAVFQKKGNNYFNKEMLMTAFYRETIRKNKSYVSLSEAVVEIAKQPFGSFKQDVVRLYKSRKKTDYSRLDTVSFKLQGGPFSSLYMDVMANEEDIFTDNMFLNYEFIFDRTLYAGGRLIYVVDFKQRINSNIPLYLGKLYIDAESMALKSAVFSLNISNREAAAGMFVLKKPATANVYPVATKYRIDYLEKDGKWYYGYSRIELGLKVDWKRRLFNTTYYTTVELSVTDWGTSAEKKSVDYKERLKPSVIISDEASGFSDPSFWGEFNVIEPEKPIETAIKKIQKQLEK